MFPTTFLFSSQFAYYVFLSSWADIHTDRLRDTTEIICQAAVRVVKNFASFKPQMRSCTSPSTATAYFRINHRPTDLFRPRSLDELRVEKFLPPMLTMKLGSTRYVTGNQRPVSDSIAFNQLLQSLILRSRHVLCCMSMIINKQINYSTNTHTQCMENDSNVVTEVVQSKAHSTGINFQTTSLCLHIPYDKTSIKQ